MTDEHEKFYQARADRWRAAVDTREAMRHVVMNAWRRATPMPSDPPPEFRPVPARRLAQIWVRYRSAEARLEKGSDLEIGTLAMLLALCNGVNGNRRLDVKRMADPTQSTDEELTQSIFWLVIGIDYTEGKNYNAHLFKFWKED